MLDTGYLILDTRYSILDTGYLILGTGYWILDTGYSITLGKSTLKQFAILPFHLAKNGTYL